MERAAPVQRFAPLVLAAALLVAGCDEEVPPLTARDLASTTEAPATAAGGPTTSAAPGEQVPSPSAPPTTGPTGEPGAAPGASQLVLTPAALGPLVLGMSEEAAVSTGLLGAVGPGCELSGTRSAPLAGGGAQGSVEFRDGVLGAITVTGGVRIEEGVAPGDALAAVGPAFGADATVDVDRSPAGAFGIWVVTAIRSDGGIYQMAVDPATETVRSVAVPGVTACE